MVDVLAGGSGNETTGTAPVLSAERVSVHFGEHHALRDVDLTVQPGEWVAIIGANGAGKTTLIRALLGLIQPDSGRVSVAGSSIAQLQRRELAQQLAWVPQRLESAPPFTIEELVLQGRAPHREHLFESASDRTIAREQMARTGVLELADRRLTQVSGGEAQRALVAAALAQQPACLLLDEPSASLDPHHALALMQILDEERQRGTAVVTATHDVNLISRFCDRIVLLVDGSVHSVGSPREVLQSDVLQEGYGPGLQVLKDDDNKPGWVVPALEQAPAPVTVPDSHDVSSRASLSPLRLVLSLLAALALASAAVVVAPLFGSASLPFSELTANEGTAHTILWQIRVPRVLLAMVTGGALAAAGAAFQALLRNPLATPYTLGIAGGASLGAVAAILAGAGLILPGVSTVPLAAFGGAFASVLAVYGMARAIGRADTLDLLLAGIAWSMISAACVLLLQYLADPNSAYQMIRWLVGGLDTVGYHGILRPLPFVLLGLLVLLWHVEALNLMSVDENLAAARGVAVGRVRLLVFVAASLVTGAVVAEVGPIGFIGLIVPHGVRAVVGGDHRVLLPCSILAGGAFLVLADTIARTALAPNELPVGVLTALVGGPLLVFLLISARR